MIIGLVGLMGSGKNTVGEILQKQYGFLPESFAKPVKDIAAIVFGWSRELLEGNTEESRGWRELKDEFWSTKLGYTVTPRLALQKIGTEAGRNVFGEGIWTEALFDRVNQMKQKYRILRTECPFVIIDSRFPNELDRIRQEGGKIVRVKRGPDPDWWNWAERKNKGEIPKNYTPLQVFGAIPNPPDVKPVKLKTRYGVIDSTSYEQPAGLPHYSEWAAAGYPVDFTIENNGTLEDLETSVYDILKQIRH